MNRLILALTVPAALAAQQVPTAFFQNSITTSANSDVMVKIAVPNPAKPVTGRPLTANEEHHSLQVLADGTRIESKTVDKFYRDDQGRTRTERQDGTIIVDDPVAHTHSQISGNGKVTRNTNFNATGANDEVLSKLKAQAEALQLQVTRGIAMNDRTYVVTSSTGSANDSATTKELRREENLGIQSVNGVLTDATRTTTTIPANQIGNDRPIDIVAERYYSTDLQMLIKSVNKDPRFGETTYELTNIQQGAPDASLFKIPTRQ